MTDPIPINPRLSLADLEEGGEPTGVADSVVLQFLDFIERDIAVSPHRLEEVSPALIANIDWLVKGIEIDIDSPLSPDDE
jgi:hypothetical protein